MLAHRQEVLFDCLPKWKIWLFLMMGYGLRRFEKYPNIDNANDTVVHITRDMIDICDKSN